MYPVRNVTYVSGRSIKHLSQYRGFGEKPCVGTVLAKRLPPAVGRTGRRRRAAIGPLPCLGSRPVRPGLRRLRKADRSAPGRMASSLLVNSGSEDQKLRILPKRRATLDSLGEKAEGRRSRAGPPGSPRGRWLPGGWTRAFALVHLRSMHQRRLSGNALLSCIGVENRLFGLGGPVADGRNGTGAGWGNGLHRSRVVAEVYNVAGADLEIDT